MKTSISTKILSPFKTEFEGEVHYIELPTTMGIVGVYPNHVPLITEISDGILKLNLSSGENIQFKIKSGFFRLEENRCKITTTNLRAE